MIVRPIVIAALALMLGAMPASAGESWDDLREDIYGDGVPTIAPDVIKLDAPYRTMTDPRTPLGATVKAPLGEFISKVTLIIDDNPMPVSAVFEMAEPQASFSFEGSMRINGPTPVRVIVETDRGGLYMQESFVKTSGVGACAAPPGVDPEIAMQTLGQMDLGLVTNEGAGPVLAALPTKTAPQSSAAQDQMAELVIDHPSHSGMQMDQISLLFIPARYIQTVAVETDGKPRFKMTGSISFSENPSLRFSLPSGSSAVGVIMTDTAGESFEQIFPLVSG